ncbi:hypothetical protein NSK_006260 [Nannochloropsis salina CCMP1776]|uniref:DUF7870 domain-containing protein n=1 Tax=Nannochloropsis salina CCMP1776 TaxID=1027361 RepID=A0A4D9CV26_9STRA|nr:hypothetical protein NSK_006260 [Nannochloropsis salina CCMP1776]|eukprot:TFJ82434.1 hypothetical protein NSK_006260 [Nannochloropsis salina CCMP1776]
MDLPHVERFGDVDTSPVSSSQSLYERMEAVEENMKVLQKRFWQEPLEPIWQYRGKYYLGKTDDVEDKDQVTPFFLANFVNASDPAVYKRKIYIDLGIKDFNSSLCWIMQNYPVKFDAIHGFECASDLSDIAALSGQIDACVRGTAADLKQGYTPEGVKDILHIYYNYIGTDENPATQPPTRGLSQVMKDLNIEKDDYVVVKMDVEEMEYVLLDKIIADGTYKLIDEMFVEIHYKHPEMDKFGWQTFHKSRNDAQALFTKARDVGMFIHPWP